MKIFKQVTANNIALTPYPFRKELAMEACLIENEEILSLDNENFTEVAVLDEEIALEKGGKSRDGRIDILASYGAEYLSIVELKLNQINKSSLEQLERYLDQKEQIIEVGDYWTEEFSPKWIGVLVGTSICPELQKKLEQGYKHNNEIPIAGIVLNRFRSPDNQIFVVSDTYFYFSYSDKDYSKFMYKGNLFNKGRLVNEIVRDYVDLNPEVTFPKLKEIFPKSIQGSFGVFDKLSRAQDIYQNTNHKRHYIKDSETIHLIDGEIIATCNQWNPFNIAQFINVAEILGFNIDLK